MWEERGFKGREVGEISVQLANYVDSITVPPKLNEKYRDRVWRK